MIESLHHPKMFDDFYLLPRLSYPIKHITEFISIFWGNHKLNEWPIKGMKNSSILFEKGVFG